MTRLLHQRRLKHEPMQNLEEISKMPNKQMLKEVKRMVAEIASTLRMIRMRDR